MKTFFILFLSFNFLFALNTTSEINLTNKEQLWLKNNPNIQLAIISDQEPVTITKNGIITGILPEYIDFVSKKIGQKIRLVTYPNAQSVLKVSSKVGVYGTATIFKVDKYKDIFHFTKPYLETSFNFFVNKEHAYEIKNEKDLNGKTLVILKNNIKLLNYAKKIKGVKILYAQSIEEQFEMLQYNKVDAVIGYINYHYLLNKMLFNKVTFAFSTSKIFGVRMGINKEHKILLQILNKVITTLSEHQKQQILGKWLTTANSNLDYLTFDEKNWLKENHTVRIRVGNWPPFQMNENNKFEGISVEYIRKIFNKFNINYQFISSKQVSWSESLNLIANKKEIDLILTASITPQRAKKMLFTDTYISPPWVIFTRNNYGFISKVEDLYGKTVAVQDGYIMQDILRSQYPKINLQVIKNFHSTEDAIKAVALGNADAFIGNLATGSYISKKLYFDNIKVASPTKFGNHENAMAVRNDWSPLVSIINRELKLIASTNEKDDIYNKYLSMKYEYGISLLDVSKWIGILVIIFGSIVITIGISNRKLALEIQKR